MREFLNCSKKKKIEDTRKIESMGLERQSQMDASFRKSRANRMQAMSNQRLKQLDANSGKHDDLNDRAANFEQATTKYSTKKPRMH